jgi:hypothetical protein
MEASPQQSSSTTKKWLIGCGIGCGAIIIIIVIAIASGFFFFKNIVDEFKDTEVLMDTLTERYGRIKDFCPNTDGSISQDRIEAFLEVRENFSSVREKIAGTFATLSEEEQVIDIEGAKPKNVLKMIRLGFGVVPQVAEFIKSRNQALLDAEMGVGEYYYIYVVSYYSWLGKPPEDGPDFQIRGPDEEEGPFRYWRREDFEGNRQEWMLRGIHRMILPMLRNQLDALEQREAAVMPEAWRQSLAGEIEAMEADKGRLPWQDGVPPAIETSLKPFKERLEASYSSMTNPLELAIEQH